VTAHSIEMELQEKLDDVVSPVLAALPVAIPYFDHAPQAQDYPFCELARISFRTDDDLTRDQQRATITFAVYSAGRGKRQVVEAMAALRQALHMQKLALPSGEAVNVEHEQSDAVADGDGVTYIGTAIFTAWLASH